MPFEFLDKTGDFFGLWVEYLLEELRSEFFGNGEFVGSMDTLVEVAAQPTELLLIAFIVFHHCMKGIDFAECGGVVELFDGIAYHRADSLVAGCFPDFGNESPKIPFEVEEELDGLLLLGQEQSLR